ncbi:thrombospondin type-1 domain-containing 7B isoform X1 [Labeo rohita]|uniref:Thrombospondin type-1 domain-containing 7B isoform X1 n=1 Tax=Labeo rohita TaxID=84645 RepID=A0A498LCY7_LABRO|nr:thrombospondin type-1 domain-containing 7B isoform X1 [Labeo rohita]
MNNLGLKVDRTSMGWTMILKDDSGVTGWTWRVGNYLLLSMSLIGMQVRSDLEFPKDRHYTWKTDVFSVPPKSHTANVLISSSQILYA